MSDLLMRRRAFFSSCRTWRYRAERDLMTPGLSATLCMVNPSTADEENDDATFTRVLGFGARLGITRWVIVNMFALVSTDIKGLRTAPDPIGPENDAQILRAFQESDLAIVAWGALAKLPREHVDRWRSVVAMAKAADRQLQCWGVNADGQPKHPLYLPYTAELSDWRIP